MKKTAVIAGIIVLFLAGGKQAFADSSSCQIIYGGGQACPEEISFSINKTVQKPGTNDFIDNLSVNDPKFQPGQTVNFQIVVDNTGSQSITNLVVTDQFPQYVNFVSGPGDFDTSSSTLTITVNSLATGASKTFNIAGKVADASLLPEDQGVVCVTNVAKGSVDTNTSAQDTSQFCIEKQVLGATPQVFSTPQVQSTPSTGPEMLPLFGLLASGATGMFLRKKSSK